MMRFQFPPDNPADAGPTHRSRLYERFVDLFPVVTYATLIWCAVVFINLWRMDKENYEAFFQALLSFGMVTEWQVAQGRWWGMITSAFVHYDFLHFVFNMYWLISFGALMERGLGSIKTALFFAITAFVSSTYQMQIGGHGIGFSGVVYAMGGFMWGAWPRFTGFLEGFSGHTLRWFFVWQAICFLLSFGGMLPIGNTAHISGMIFGFLLGMWAHKGTKGGWYWLLAAVLMTAGAIGICINMMY